MTAIDAISQWLAKYKADAKNPVNSLLGMYGEHNAPGLDGVKRALANAVSVVLSLAAASSNQAAEIRRLRAELEELKKR